MSKPKSGDHSVRMLNQMWEPVACPLHSFRVEEDFGDAHREGDGFTPDCPYCVEQWETTSAHIEAVRRDRKA